MLNSRQFTARVLLQRETEETSATNQPVSVWTTYAETRGKITPIGVREPISSNQKSPFVAHRLELRFRPGILARDRAVVTIRGVTATYDIHGVYSTGDFKRRAQWSELIMEALAA